MGHLKNDFWAQLFAVFAEAQHEFAIREALQMVSEHRRRNVTHLVDSWAGAQDDIARAQKGLKCAIHTLILSVYTSQIEGEQ